MKRNQKITKTTNKTKKSRKIKNIKIKQFFCKKKKKPNPEGRTPPLRRLTCSYRIINHSTTTTGSNRLRCPLCVIFCWSNPCERPLMAECDSGSAAWRRRQRRLRMHWRHEQLTLCVVLTGTPLLRRPTGTEYSHQDQGVGTRRTTRPRSPPLSLFPSPLPRGARHAVLQDG